MTGGFSSRRPMPSAFYARTVARCCGGNCGGALSEWGIWIRASEGRRLLEINISNYSHWSIIPFPYFPAWHSHARFVRRSLVVAATKSERELGGVGSARQKENGGGWNGERPSGWVYGWSVYEHSTYVNTLIVMVVVGGSNVERTKRGFPCCCYRLAQWRGAVSVVVVRLLL